MRPRRKNCELLHNSSKQMYCLLLDFRWHVVVLSKYLDHVHSWLSLGSTGLGGVLIYFIGKIALLTQTDHFEQFGVSPRQIATAHELVEKPCTSISHAMLVHCKPGDHIARATTKVMFPTCREGRKQPTPRCFMTAPRGWSSRERQEIAPDKRDEGKVLDMPRQRCGAFALCPC